MWVRGAAIRPVPEYAVVARTSLEVVAGELESRFEPPDGAEWGALFDRFASTQPHLFRQVTRVLERPLDETAQALGYFLVLSIWLSFERAFGARLLTVTKEMLAATEESLRVEEELRREHSEEPLDLEDIVQLQQPHVLDWIHEQVDAITDHSQDDDEEEIDLDDLHLVYRAVMAMTLALSYSVTGPSATNEIFA